MTARFASFKFASFKKEHDMQLTRKEFIGGSAAMMGAAVVGRVPYRAEDYAIMSAF